MTLINIITAICFAFLTLEAGAVIVYLIYKRNDRSERIAFIRSFKRGKCIAILLTAIPLIFLGYWFKSENFYDSFLNAITHVVELVVLKFDLGKIQELIDANLFYKITIYYCCTLVTINAILFALSLTSQRLWQWCEGEYIKHTKKDKLFIFGYNDNNLLIYNSDNTNKAVIVDNIATEDRASLYSRKIRFIVSDDFEKITDKMFNPLCKKLKKVRRKEEFAILCKMLKKDGRKEVLDALCEILKKDDQKETPYTLLKELDKNKRKEVCADLRKVLRKEDKKNDKNDNRIIVVINAVDDDKNLRLGQIFVNKIKSFDEEGRERLFDFLDVFIFGDPRYETIYASIVKESFGCIHYKNKYQMIAMNFIDKYPLTRFMDDRHIDYSTALVNPTTDINVCMIGFGKPNQQIFLTSIANNQFITKKGNDVVLKQVNYHIFDKRIAENNKNLNHSYYRYRNECRDIDASEYLPLPKYPANEMYYHLDINSHLFYRSIKEIVTAKQNDVNFIIVSFNNDLENIDMAKKLIEKCREWNIEDITIFVRVRGRHNDYDIFDEKNVFPIGNEAECVYNINEITHDQIYRMAHMRNESYDLEYQITSKQMTQVDETFVAKNSKDSHRNWFNKTQWERDSSLYCCLSLRSKLNMIGLDYCGKDDNDLPAMSEEEYIHYYAGNDLPVTYAIDGYDRKIVNYTLNFAESTRKNLAVHEHLRWNSFMISQGMIPASKDQILNEKVEKNGKLKNTNGKNYELRRHGNLTTYDGLVEFRQMLAKRDGDDEATHDVIKYDYQLLDDAYWLLSKNGYKIIKRQK